MRKLLLCLVPLLGACSGDSSSASGVDWGGAQSPLALGSTWQIRITTPAVTYQSADPSIIKVSDVMTDQTTTPPLQYVQLTALAAGTATLSATDASGTTHASFTVQSVDKLGLYLITGPPGSDADRADLWVHTSAGLGLHYYAGGQMIWGQGAYALTKPSAFDVTTSDDLFVIQSTTRPASESLTLTNGATQLALPVHIVADADVTRLALIPEAPVAPGTDNDQKTRVWGTGTTTGGQTIYGVPFDWSVDAQSFPVMPSSSTQSEGDVFRYVADKSASHTVKASFAGSSVTTTISGTPLDVTWQFASGCHVSGGRSGGGPLGWPSFALGLCGLSLLIRRRRRTAFSG